MAFFLKTVTFRLHQKCINLRHSASLFEVRKPAALLTAVRLELIASTASKPTHLVGRSGGVTIAFSWVKSLKILMVIVECIFLSKKWDVT